MKKKLLSLALVLAMALTLLPTAALAASSHSDSNCTDTQDPTEWTTKDENGHSGACQTTADCVVSGPHEWENGACTVCSYEHPASAHTVKADTVAAGTGGKHTYTCNICGKTGIEADCAAAQTATYTAGTSQNGLDTAKHYKNCEVCNTPIASTGEAHAPKAASGSTYYATPKEGSTTQHTFTCDVCKATDLVGTCVKGSDNKCTLCGRDMSGNVTITSFGVAPSSHPPFTAGAAVSFSIDTVNAETENTDALRLTGVTWTLKGAQADTTGTLTAAPSTPGTYDLVFTAEVAKDGFVLDEGVTSRIGDVEVLAVPAPETPAEKPEDTTNKAPSTNSQGIPVANEVTTEKQATQAVNTLKNTNAAVLQDRLMTNDTALSSFKSLESAVISTKHIKVEVSKESSAPSDVRTGVDIDGAAFNASSSNSTVSLVVGAPSQAYPITAGYQISMTLTGVGSASSLAVPVVITLPIPSDVKPERVVVLHYHDGSSTPSVIDPVVSGDSIRFTVTGFSDFVVTDQSIPTSRTNGGTGYLGGNLKNNQNDISDILPAIAAMLSGDGVFVDVPAEHWAAKEIRWARDGGLMSGYGNGGFGPTASTTRQQLWMVLARLSGTRPADMAMARQWAINTGVSDGSNPTGVLSRQQLVTMLYRFAKSQGKDVSASAKLSGYADSAKVASYAKEALSWAAAKGIVSGSNGKLNPEGTATRAHFAVFLYRYSNG